MFPGPIPLEQGQSTANRTLLVVFIDPLSPSGSQGFAALAGSQPDYTVEEAPFFSLDGDAIEFLDPAPGAPPPDIGYAAATAIGCSLSSDVLDCVDFSAEELPLDGTDSLHRDNPGGVVPGGLFPAANTPTNFDGEQGIIALPEPSTAALRLSCLLVLGLLSVSSRRRLSRS